MTISPARKAAFAILRRVESDGAYSSELLHASPLMSGIDERDRGLASEIVLGCLRWRGALDALIARASNRAAHSSFPELGESAIDKLLDALMVIRGLELPDDPLLGRTHYNVGLIEGGVAPNVISPHASAELMFRIVGDGAPIRAALRVVESLVAVEHILEIPAVRLHTVPGFETAVFPYTTDVPVLTNWGTPLLIGPGSIHVAHTDEEHLSIEELHQAVELYASLAHSLLQAA
jgi:acetylornithine deacetylase